MAYQTGKETKKEILRVSRELFFEKGFNKTGIRTIAKRCNITSGSIYKHFKSKEEILEAIIQPHINEWWDLCKSYFNKFIKIITLNDKNIRPYLESMEYKRSRSIFFNLFHKNFDIWNFVLHNSAGTKYESFVSEFVEWEFSIFLKILDTLYPNKDYLNFASEKELKHIVRGYIDLLNSAVKLKMDREELQHFMLLINSIFNPFITNLFDENYIKNHEQF